ncbi:MAG: hypothetical protein LWW85_07105 [Marinilabiliales bacterium]|nr:hypothetical protein [Marinilabiliales bacterium]
MFRILISSKEESNLNDLMRTIQEVWPDAEVIASPGPIPSPEQLIGRMPDLIFHSNWKDVDG